MTIIKIFLTGLIGVSLCMANISGVVTDTGSTPISGAVVQLEKGGQPVTTGEEGRFTLTASAILLSNGKLLSNGLSAGITGNLMTVTIAERTVVEITIFDLNGKALSNIRQTMETGVHTITLPQRSAGIYLFKVKVGNGEVVLKSNSVGGSSSGSGAFSQGPSSNSQLKQAKTAVVINDVIAAMKTGYLNYRCVQYNSDTTGIVIKMIASAGTVTDADGNVYQTVRIGNQVWMAENLRVTKYNDNTPIPLDTSILTWHMTATPKYCFYENTVNTDSIRKYGALYNWYVVSSANPKKIAPTGWHMPTDSEWTILENYLVLNGYNFDGTKDTSRYNKIAKSLAAKTDWHTDTSMGDIGCDLSMNNSSGFSALPGGIGNGGFDGQSYVGYWWSSTDSIFGIDDPSIAYGRTLLYGYGHVMLTGVNGSKTCGFSVRLLRDN